MSQKLAQPSFAEPSVLIWPVVHGDVCGQPVPTGSGATLQRKQPACLRHPNLFGTRPSATRRGVCRRCLHVPTPPGCRNRSNEPAVARTATGYSDNVLSPLQAGGTTIRGSTLQLRKRPLLASSPPVHAALLRRPRISMETEFPASRPDAGSRLAPDPCAGIAAVTYCIAHVYRRSK